MQKKGRINMYLVDDCGHRYELKNLETLNCSIVEDGIIFFFVKQILRKDHIEYLEKELKNKTNMNCVVLDSLVENVVVLETPHK